MGRTGSHGDEIGEDFDERVDVSDHDPQGEHEHGGPADEHGRGGETRFGIDSGQAFGELGAEGVNEGVCGPADGDGDVSEQSEFGEAERCRLAADVYVGAAVFILKPEGVETGGEFLRDSSAIAVVDDPSGPFAGCDEQEYGDAGGEHACGWEHPSAAGQREDGPEEDGEEYAHEGQPIVAGSDEMDTGLTVDQSQDHEIQGHGGDVHGQFQHPNHFTVGAHFAPALLQSVVIRAAERTLRY